MRWMSSVTHLTNKFDAQVKGTLPYICRFFKLYSIQINGNIFSKESSKKMTNSETERYKLIFILIRDQVKQSIY